MAKNDFDMADGILAPCNVARGCGIVTLNSPSGSTLQCDTQGCRGIPMGMGVGWVWGL